MSARPVLFTDSDVFAGTERHICELASGLANSGIRVAIACPVPSAIAKHASAAGIQIWPISKNGSIDWRAIWKLRCLCLENRFDIIHSHNGRTAFIAAIATALAGRGRCVYTQHFLEPSYVSRRGIRAKFSRIIHRWVDRRTAHLIANSLATCRGAIERGEAKTDGVTVIPNGIAGPDLSALRPRALVREDLGVPGVPLVVCAARLEPEKDVATLVDAMKLVVCRYPEAVCLIAGEGSLRRELQDRISRLGLEKSVRLLGFRADVMSIMNAGDLFVLPSLAEPFGLVLVEAMSLGKAVIAIAAGGPVEIVEQGKTGLLVPPQSPREMAAAIGQLLASHETRQQMGNRGEARYRAEFTVERMAQQTLSVYQSVLAAPPREPTGAVADSVSA